MINSKCKLYNNIVKSSLNNVPTTISENMRYFMYKHEMLSMRTKFPWSKYVFCNIILLFIFQVNLYLTSVDISKMHSTFCMHMYVCEFWNLNVSDVNSLHLQKIIDICSGNIILVIVIGIQISHTVSYE